VSAVAYPPYGLRLCVATSVMPRGLLSCVPASDEVEAVWCVHESMQWIQNVEAWLIAVVE